MGVGVEVGCNDEHFGVGDGVGFVVWGLFLVALFVVWYMAMKIDRHFGK